jgi:hypothetical protein
MVPAVFHTMWFMLYLTGYGSCLFDRMWFLSNLPGCDSCYILQIATPCCNLKGRDKKDVIRAIFDGIWFLLYIDRLRFLIYLAGCDPCCTWQVLIRCCSLTGVSSWWTEIEKGSGEKENKNNKDTQRILKVFLVRWDRRSSPTYITVTRVPVVYRKTGSDT